jgi:N-ethylmaleimide reductase
MVWQHNAMTTLFDPVQVGAMALPNRIVMAPLTRNRAPGAVPTPLMATYYAQRATAGLLITEATAITQQGQGYADVPGLYSPAQIAGWKQVTDAVHAAGGRIVCQLWHVGRVSHVELQPGGAAPVAPSAIPARTKTVLFRDGVPTFVETSVPRALSAAEIPGIVDDYARAARAAVAAGFDGVEIHGANGYLIDQFLRDSINDRSDAYGGPIANRVRLLSAVMTAVAGEIGGGRVGLRLSPVTPSNDAGPDSDPQALFEAAVDALAPLKLAYLHVIEGQTGGPRDVAPFDYAALRRRFAGAWMVNNGYTRTMALDAVARGAADLVAFGKAFIANPDLGLRLRLDAPLNVPDKATMYGGGAAGYTDYPALDRA